MTIFDHWIAPLLVLALVCVNDCASAQDWTEHEVTVARLAVNEATFRTADAAAIAEARGRYTVDELRAMHPRALAPVRTDSRRWIADLSADAHRPDGWPESLVPWETRGRLLWLSVLRTVRETIAGRRACSSRPSIWGGRRVDEAHIRRRLADGYEIVRCGQTGNVYMRRGGR